MARDMTDFRKEMLTNWALREKAKVRCGNCGDNYLPGIEYHDCLRFTNQDTKDCYYKANDPKKLLEQPLPYLNKNFTEMLARTFTVMATIDPSDILECPIARRKIQSFSPLVEAVWENRGMIEGRVALIYYSDLREKMK